MKNQKIYLLPVDKIDSPVLEHIGKTLQRTFAVPFRLLNCDDELIHSPGLVYEGKYNSTAVLLYIARGMCINHGLPPDMLKVLAITQLDLYSPIFSYLYGEAQLKGTAALMSLFRLRQEFYRQPTDRDIFLSRCEKEALHEIGHTFGLMHCKDKNCVMYPSSTINDTDTKSNSFCLSCNDLLKI